eukprot:TRINITY_DN7363_c0_g1_i1.p1 TRINITY_DN7363_c0_g1~~TRINITY_DN7363_c0_g1_i1.p1  ORF type:complete len:347 (+),score=50.38 TRINITY_DN7363_c0_g1_i1:132-1172(+)
MFPTLCKFIKRILSTVDFEKVPTYRRLADGFSLSPAACKAVYGSKVTKVQLTESMGADLVLPKTYVKGQESQGMIIYFHGGGYIFGSSKLYRMFTCRLANATKMPILVPDYRLAPESKYPEQMFDFMDALKVCNKLYKPKNLFLAGDSAGGHLITTSLMAVHNPEIFKKEIMAKVGEEQKFTSRLTPVDNVRANILISPWFDLSITSEVMASRGDKVKDLMLPGQFHEGLVDLFLKKELRSSFVKHPFLSPAQLPQEFHEGLRLEKMPDTLIHAGSADVVVLDVFEFKKRFEKYLESTPDTTEKPKVRMEIFDGMPHVFQLTPLLKEGEESLNKISKFIQEVSAKE